MIRAGGPARRRLKPVDVVELGGGEEAVDRSRTPAALIGAGEGSELAAQIDGLPLSVKVSKKSLSRALTMLFDAGGSLRGATAGVGAWMGNFGKSVRRRRRHDIAAAQCDADRAAVRFASPRFATVCTIHSALGGGIIVGVEGSGVGGLLESMGARRLLASKIVRCSQATFSNLKHSVFHQTFISPAE